MGILSFNEFKQGRMTAGWVETADCNDEHKDDFQDFFGVSGNTVTWDQIQTNADTWRSDMWNAVTNGNGDDHVSYTRWMQNTNMNMGMDQLTADNVFMRGAGNWSKTVNKKQFDVAFNAMLKDLWNYYEEQYLVVNGVPGQQPWFFTESCF